MKYENVFLSASSIKEADGRAAGYGITSFMLMGNAGRALLKYIEGMELTSDMTFSKGLGAICVLGVPLGGIRNAGGRLKNLYPKGLRDHL